MTYKDIMPEINTMCKKNPKCYVDKAQGRDNGCPYFDLCFANYEGPNNGNTALEAAILARYMELKTGKPHSRFYFTFGSDPGFPFQNAFIIVLAESEKAAVEKFRAKYPDRHKGIANCAFWYSEERWAGTVNASTYTEPAVVIA